jgi:hypothetical protein
VSPRSKFSSGLGTASALVAAICTGLCHSRCHNQTRFRGPQRPLDDSAHSNQPSPH